MCGHLWHMYTPKADGHISARFLRVGESVGSVQCGVVRTCSALSLLFTSIARMCAAICAFAASRLRASILSIIRSLCRGRCKGGKQRGGPRGEGVRIHPSLPLCSAIHPEVGCSAVHPKVGPMHISN